MAYLKPLRFIYMQQQARAECRLAHRVRPFMLRVGFAKRELGYAEQMCQTANKDLASVALLSCRCDENEIWGSWKVAALPVSRTLV